MTDYRVTVHEVYQDGHEYPPDGLSNAINVSAATIASAIGKAIRRRAVTEVLPGHGRRVSLTVTVTETP